jgi:hypothetical protein
MSIGSIDNAVSVREVLVSIGRLPVHRLTDETGEYEVIGWSYTTAAGKTAERSRQAGRVRRPDDPRAGAHERVSVKRRRREISIAPGSRGVAPRLQIG